MPKLLEARLTYSKQWKTKIQW